MDPRRDISVLAGHGAGAAMMQAAETQGWMLPLIGFAVAITATPGPNNAMAASSGATFGFRRTLPLMLGTAVGLMLMLMAVSLGAAGLLRDWPQVERAARWLGLAYLLWLAWRLAKAEPMASRDGSADARSRPLNLLEAALFQWINPKAWLAVSSGIATYGADAAMTLGTVFFLAALHATAAWTALGVAASGLLRSRKAVRGFNLAMAALLLVSLLPVLLWP